MNKKSSELSIEIYHRIYRLVLKKATPEQIAYTLNLPLGIIKNIVKHFNTKKSKTPKIKEDIPLNTNINEEKSYLDIYVLSRLKFSILDLNGMIIENHGTNLQIAFDKMIRSDLKAVALLMKNVKTIDEFGLNAILYFHKTYFNKGRYTAILDPDPAVENLLIANKIEQKMDIFGTEKAFEDKALKSMKQK